MSIETARLWRDKEQNVYGVEKSARTGLWIVIRTNEGGNRKGFKQIPPENRQDRAQLALDCHAAKAGWTEIPA